MRTILYLISAIGLSVSAIAQSPSSEAPRTLLRFLKPGDLVGLKLVEGTASTIISTYSKDQFDLAKLLVNRHHPTNATEFAAESELARHAFEDFVVQNAHVAYIDSQLTVMPLIRTSLGKIAEVGDDYILVEIEDTSKSQCVIAKTSVGRIYLDANPARFDGPRRVAKSEAE